MRGNREIPDGMIPLLRQHGVLLIELSPFGTPFAIDGELYTIGSIGDLIIRAKQHARSGSK